MGRWKGSSREPLILFKACCTMARHAVLVCRMSLTCHCMLTWRSNRGWSGAYQLEAYTRDTLWMIPVGVQYKCVYA